MWIICLALIFLLLLSTGQTSYETSKLGIACAMLSLVSPAGVLFHDKFWQLKVGISIEDRVC